MWMLALGHRCHSYIFGLIQDSNVVAKEEGTAEHNDETCEDEIDVQALKSERRVTIEI